MPLIFIPTLIVFQILLLIVHLTVYATASAAFGLNSRVLWWFLAFLSLTFVPASVLVYWSRNRIAQWYYAFAAHWFGLVHFLFMGGVAFFFFLVMGNVFGWRVNLPLAGGICFGIFFLLHLYGTWNSGRARVVRVTVPLQNIPEYWRDHSLVFISDIHLGAIRGAGFVKKIVEKINAVTPAAVMIGGDLYDGVKCDAEALVAPLRDLVTAHGTYYVTGNHEFYGEFGRSVAAITAAGVTILKNETVAIEGMQFTGVDYRDVHKRDDFIKVLDGIALQKNMPSILIKHEPDNLDIAEQKGFSAGFFGHTHQGQIYPLMHITRKIYHGFDYGLRRFKKMWVYTSSGVGTWGPPLRLGTKSEIVVVRFV